MQYKFNVSFVGTMRVVLSWHSMTSNHVKHVTSGFRIVHCIRIFSCTHNRVVCHYIRDSPRKKGFLFGSFACTMCCAVLLGVFELRCC